MVENGQVWASGGRTVRVVDRRDARIIVRDTYGWRRSLTENELEHGFANVTDQVEPDQVEPVGGVMARRTLADLEPA